ncbi:DUF1517 domain-containing protein [Leptolyngbya sp. CCNP1308]|uniref:DUF1517 domain-containing protein n=1 Tax=Leptolyngbya sp. CCNP1308 TaxID=3110255 RepID=UPI002B1FB5CE|nr:DUF1517 domain-containing protein [Leptolyngbya sp. CCNP1308]MEA5450316.1 DUF1517 domain-containing protein [Leptolyngbya sp. CCNP1308]
MATAPRFRNGYSFRVGSRTLCESLDHHSRNVYCLIVLMLTLSCLGFFVERRNEAARLAQAQGLLSTSTAPLGLSGGRARGGDFGSPSGSGSAGGGFSGGSGSLPPMGGPSYGGPSYGGPSYGGGYPSYPRTGPVIVPVPGGYVGGYPGGYVGGYPGGGTMIGGDVGLLFLLVVLGFTVLPLITNLMRLGGDRPDRSVRGVGGNELTNDVVTVTQLQVALLSQARDLQSDLETIAARSDIDTKPGLNRLLQETVLALLRSPEYWSHAKASSQTVHSRAQASQIFEQISVTERSKFSRETLVNVDGQVSRQTYAPKADADPSAYIVVTLIVGTADDQPIVTQPINSASDLQAALRRLGGVTPDYLLVYELLWAPQAASDSLSYDQLLAAYPDLTQIS